MESGKWELIDGLQRVSTILEFVGILRKPSGELYDPSIMESTRYLAALEGVSWDGGVGSQKPLGSAQQIAIKRARVSIQILRKSSDEQAKYDLFQRLNSHGSQATAQELRNCVLYMFNKQMFQKMKSLASDPRFLELIQVSDTGSRTQIALDFLTRYLVFLFVEYDSSWDIEEFLNNGIIELSKDPPEHTAALL